MSDDAPTKDVTLQDLLDELIAERGGPACFSTVQRLAARAMIRAMVAIQGGKLSSTASIEAIERMLPPRVEQPQSKPWNLELLSDHQLAVLEKLAAVATGEVPPRTEHRPRSRRYWLAQDLARVLDGGVTGDIGRAKASEETLIEVRNLVQDLLSPLYLPTLFEETFRGAWSVSTWVPPAPIPAVENNAPAAVPESPRVPAATNVVPLARGNGSLPR